MFNMKITALSCGWADLQINMNQQVKMYYFENVPNDALNDILLSAIRVMKTGPDSIIVFPNGSQKSAMRVLANDTSCDVSFEHESLCMLKEHYAKAVMTMFDEYINEHSLKNYESEWNSFPVKELEILRAACK